MAKQGRHGVRKSNSSSQQVEEPVKGCRKEGAHSHSAAASGRLPQGKDSSGVRSVPTMRVFFQACWGWQSRNRA